MALIVPSGHTSTITGSTCNIAQSCQCCFYFLCDVWGFCAPGWRAQIQAKYVHVCFCLASSVSLCCTVQVLLLQVRKPTLLLLISYAYVRRGEAGSPTQPGLYSELVLFFRREKRLAVILAPANAPTPSLVCCTVLWLPVAPMLALLLSHIMLAAHACPRILHSPTAAHCPYACPHACMLALLVAPRAALVCCTLPFSHIAPMLAPVLASVFALVLSRVCCTLLWPPVYLMRPRMLHSFMASRCPCTYPYS